ncbi:DUF805 domain-containing protein [Phenylobacterium sp. 58.2.17]|uniref:DUF805 domain-containing protein n=1 Tax=Phenylobacterium sp. 58.2.17 TaxID=2969306 RepID=UPI0022654888|nr:DUF805 domain-containing protein [Phenylobacterium sp. 58.2.17]MCX7588990.1 DUF805 domain-containing protein [Phenylobacterium sp. 58.2.17]
MDLKEIDWQTLYLSGRGRIGRAEFWIGAAGLICIGLVAGLIPVVGVLASLALIYPWACLTAKRLHDFGRSGLLVLVAAVPAVVAGVFSLVTALAASNISTIGMALAGASLSLAVSTVALLVSLGFVLWVGLTPGHDAANSYGARMQGG